MQTERPITKQDQINAIVDDLMRITKRQDEIMERLAAIESKDSKAPAKKKRPIGHSLGIK